MGLWLGREPQVQAWSREKLGSSESHHFVALTVKCGFGNKPQLKDRTQQCQRVVFSAQALSNIRRVRGQLATLVLLLLLHPPKPDQLVPTSLNQIEATRVFPFEFGAPSSNEPQFSSVRGFLKTLLS